MIGWKRLYAKPAGSLPGGVVTQYGVGALTVFILLFLTYWIWFGGGEPAELPGAGRSGANRAPQLYRAHGRAGGRRSAPGGNPAVGGGSSLAGAAATANQHRRSRRRSSDRQRSDPTSRAKPRHRPTLHRGRMGLARTLAPGSARTAQPFASQFAHSTDLSETGRRRRERR